MFVTYEYRINLLRVEGHLLPYYPTCKFGMIWVTTLKGKPLEFYSLFLNPNVLHNENGYITGALREMNRSPIKAIDSFSSSR
jgi:hypothetical protein